MIILTGEGVCADALESRRQHHLAAEVKTRQLEVGYLGRSLGKLDSGEAHACHVYLAVAPAVGVGGDVAELHIVEPRAPVSDVDALCARQTIEKTCTELLDVGADGHVLAVGEAIIEESVGKVEIPLCATAIKESSCGCGLLSPREVPGCC